MLLEIKKVIGNKNFLDITENIKKSLGLVSDENRGSDLLELNNLQQDLQVHNELIASRLEKIEEKLG